MPAPAASGPVMEPRAPDKGPEERARLLFEQGVEAAGARRWDEAERFFSQSASIVERPSALFNRAIALIELKRGLEAMAVVDRWLAIASGATPAEAQEAAELRRQAEALLATLVLNVQPPDARIEINGASSPVSGPRRTLRLDPGGSELLVQADGYRAIRGRLELSPGGTKELRVELQAEVQTGARNPATTARRRQSPPKAVDSRTSADRASTTGPLPYALLASGAGLVVAGAITGLLALDADRDVTEACPARENCDPSLRARRDDAVTLALVTDVLVGAGVASLGSGWLLLELGAPARSSPAGSSSPSLFIASVRRSW